MDEQKGSLSVKPLEKEFEREGLRFRLTDDSKLFMLPAKDVDLPGFSVRKSDMLLGTEFFVTADRNGPLRSIVVSDTFAAEVSDRIDSIDWTTTNLRGREDDVRLAKLLFAPIDKFQSIGDVNVGDTVITRGVFKFEDAVSEPEAEEPGVQFE